MKVKDLMRDLSALPPEAEVLIADGGNERRALSVWDGLFDPNDDGYYIESYFCEDWAEDYGKEEWEEMLRTSVPCVIISP